MEKDTETKALLIKVPMEFHSKIKSIAALRNITIKKLIMRLIFAEIKRMENYK